MRIWVAGAGGVLGRHVCKEVANRGHTLVSSTHWECPIDDLSAVAKTIQTLHPDVAINCAGKLPGANALDMIMANALGPHILAAFVPRGLRLIQMSTDCVFSGRSPYRRNSRSLPDPVDLYGRTKLVGEIALPGVLVVRGSFVSKEGGFLKWLLSAKGKVEAWDNAFWTGTTVDIMAAKLVELAEGDRDGVVHAASPRSTTKGWMVEMFANRLDLNIEVIHTLTPSINRVLQPDVELPDVEPTLEHYADKMRRNG